MKRALRVFGLTLAVFAPLLILAQSQPTNPAIIYVSVSGLDSSSGLTWATAKATLQGAISSALPTGATILTGDGNFTVATQVYDMGKPVALHLGRGTYSTALANPFLLTAAGSSLVGAETTDTNGGTATGTSLDYTGTGIVNFVELGSATKGYSAGTVQGIGFNFGNAAPGSNGIVAWAPTRTNIADIMSTTMPGPATIGTEVEATGDGATKTFSFALKNFPISEYEPNKPSGARLLVKAGSVTGSDNGDGTISGTGVSGTVGYSNGDITVTFTTAPPLGTNITASYTAGGYLLALLSTEENGMGLRSSPFGVEAVQVNGANTTGKVLVQGEATGGAGSTPSYARDLVSEDADAGQFEINWSIGVELLRDSADSAIPGLPSPAFSFVEDPSAFVLGVVCSTQTVGISFYKSTIPPEYSATCAGAP